MKSLFFCPCAMVNLVVALLMFAATVNAQPLPINETLVPGDTLFVRFQLTDMGLFPDPFNGVGANFMFASQGINYTFEVALYDDDDLVVGSFGPQLAPSGFGAGPIFIDTSLGGGPASGGGRVPGDVTSYLDGNGMASFTLVSGPSVNVSTFEPLFGFHSGNSGSSPLIPHIRSHAVNQLPEPIPEPAAGVLLGLGCVMMLQRRKRC